MTQQPAPPMDEILASIRRIIAEDKPIASSVPHPAENDDEEEVLELGSIPAEVMPTYSAAPSAAPIPAPPTAPLMSGHAAEASRRAFSALSGLRLDPDAAPDTLDGLVREMLRPMLKEWLDANLPDVIERVVTREIARLGAR